MARTVAKKRVNDDSSASMSSESEEEVSVKRSKAKKQTAKRALDSSESDEPTARHPLSALGQSPNRSSPNKGKGKKRISTGPNDLRRQSFSNARLNASVNGVHPAGLGAAPQNRVVSGVRIAGLAHARAAAPRSSLGGSGTILAETPQVSTQVMNENYTEWMKMATDNKINATNTWSFALIDYFHDMSLLRNQDGDGSINFTKASCTLDGCVKIWTHRVDSTATAVGKLMNGLAEEHQTNGGDDDDLQGSDGEEGEATKQRKKRVLKDGNTLTTFAKLRQKDLDLEGSVDPLFKKTCADFDEGGASGMLMNNLGCDRSMRIVFDAGDSRLLNDEEEEAADKEDREEEADQMVDGSALKAFLDGLEVPLSERYISPSLATFKFSTDLSAVDMSIFDNLRASTSTPNTNGQVQDQILAGMENVHDLDVQHPTQDFFADPDQGQEHDVGHEDFFAPADDGPPEDDDDEQQHGDQPVPFGRPDMFRPGQKPNERDVVMAMNEDIGKDGFFDYFDSAFVKNWAGPEHWRMQRAPPPKKDEGKKTVRKEKEVFSIDFSQPIATPISDLFARPTGKTATTQLKLTVVERNSTYLLPDDMHFSSSKLLKLFIKPKAWINVRKRGRRRDSHEPDMNQEVDEHYWAQAAAANANNGADDDDEDGPLPFNTQFLHEDELDLPDFVEDDIDMDVGPSQAAETVVEDDLLAATQGQTAKRARPEYVNFAKRAKRVDVKRLKENIWKELDLTTPKDSEADFTNVLSGLRKTYPKDKMDEISTSFCFICLLHLANENDLRIKAPEEIDQVKEERIVGGLVELHINRE